MTHVLLLNLVFFAPSACGASAFAYVFYRLLKPRRPPPTTSAGSDDLARSA
jgi:hypothetical protein